MKTKNTAKQNRKNLHISPNPYKALNLIKSKNGGIHASADINFKERIFGRDSIESGEDLLKIYPELIVGIIKSLASLQGTKENLLNEEEVGKIHHEFFNGNENTIGVLRYDSVDATPLYVRLVCSYCRIYGNDLLNEEIINKEGEKVTIEKSVLDALIWIVRKIYSSPIFLLEFKRIVPPESNIFWPNDKDAILNNDHHFANHIENQVWTDSYTALIHENGELANHDMPIAPVEVQAVVYDALMMASAIFSSKLPEESLKWKQIARKVQSQTFSLFWDWRKRYFARAIDRDDFGRIRKINTASSMPAELLDSMIFDNLPIQIKRIYIGGIVNKIFSKDFLTDFGIRSRSLSVSHLVPYADYHGSLTSWVKETFDIAKGLRRQGFIKLALELENRITNALILTGTHDEFFYIDESGNLRLPQKDIESDNQIIGTNIPESTQAWTISAFIALKDINKIPLSTRNHLLPILFSRIPAALTLTTFIPTPTKTLWTGPFEERIIRRIPNINVISTKQKKNNWKSKIVYTKVNTNEGLRMEKEIFRKKYSANHH